MTFGESISTCFKKYFVIQGRASKSEFWWFQLLWSASIFIMFIFEGSEPVIYFFIVLFFCFFFMLVYHMSLSIVPLTHLWRVTTRHSHRQAGGRRPNSAHDGLPEQSGTLMCCNSPNFF